MKVAISGCWDLGFSCERKKERLGVWKRQWVGSMKVECGCFAFVIFGERDVPIFFERCEKIMIGVVL